MSGAEVVDQKRESANKHCQRAAEKRDLLRKGAARPRSGQALQPRRTGTNCLRALKRRSTTIGKNISELFSEPVPTRSRGVSVARIKLVPFPKCPDLSLSFENGFT